MNEGDAAERLERYCALWGLAEPTLIAETVTSKVYTVGAGGERVILKLLTPVGEQDESSGAVALRCWDGSGAVRLLKADSQAHLLEYAAGEDLIGMVKNGDDDQATTIIADVLNRMHSVPMGAAADGLILLRRWFRDLLVYAGEEPVLRRGAAVAERLLNAPQQIAVLHGDIHHENIRHHAARGWLAFDPKGLIGERAFDAANTLCNPLDRPELVEDEATLMRRVEILARVTGIEAGRILAFGFAYFCLSACWLLGDGLDADHELKMASLIEPHARG